jgi:hypothetical protein
MSHKFKYNHLKDMHQTKTKLRVQHNATFHSPLRFCLVEYNYIFQWSNIPYSREKRKNEGFRGKGKDEQHLNLWILVKKFYTPKFRVLHQLDPSTVCPKSR